MRQRHRLYLILVVTIVALSGCAPDVSTISPSFTKTLPPSAAISQTITPIPSYTQAATLTQPMKLNPEQAKETIQTLLQETIDCLAPCFWGMRPEQTTLREAKNFFSRLGLELKHTNTRGDKNFYGVIYNFDNGLQVTPVLTTQNDIVKNFRISISPENYKAGVPRKWLAYSPETLIRRYGPPSKVGFGLNTSSPTSLYTMVIYFDTVDLIFEYGSYDVDTKLAGSVRICPLIDQPEAITIWLGKNPEHPPSYNPTPLEDATNMTINDYSKLMTGPIDKACINLKKELFP